MGPALSSRRWLVALGAALLPACPSAGGAGHPHGAHGPHAAHHEGASTSAPASHVEEALAAVRAIHGGAGPWAVAGYRIGEAARAKLGLERGSFDLEVVHHTPPEVQYSCIADGAAASTGASLGKLNLSLEPATALDTRTVVRKRSTGETLTYKLTDAFMVRFKDVPREKLAEAGREAAGLGDAEIFELVEPAPPVR